MQINRFFAVLIKAPEIEKLGMNWTSIWGEELAISAKSMLMAREFGMDVKIDDEIKAKFKELHALERSIGKAGFLAMRPYLHMSRKDLWQLFLLED